MREPSCVVASRDVLGECPVWNQHEASVYWVDIERKLLHSFHPSTGASRCWSFPERIGTFAFRRGGGIVAGLESGIYFYDLEQCSLASVASPEAGSGTRFNDGKCDRQGRFWAGTMDTNAREAKGTLYCVDLELRCRPVITGIGIPNGLAWSPDGATFYYADSLQRRIYACDFEAVGPRLSRLRIFADLTDRPGLPDGAAVDEEGLLWSAQCNGWRLYRYAPDGRVDAAIELPVQYPTSCCFGGPDRRTLYITSAVWDLTGEALGRQPFAGGLLALEVGVRGLEENWFGG